MRGVRFNKAELAYLLDLLEYEIVGEPAKARKLSASIREKLQKAQEPAGVDVGPIEDALVKASLGKVVPLEGGYARASRQAKAVGVTPELAELVGKWIARQHWLSSPLTLIDVLNKWHQWLPKARATEPPPGMEPGLQRGPGEKVNHGKAGSSTPAERPAPAGRGAKAGFR